MIKKTRNKSTFEEDLVGKIDEKLSDIQFIENDLSGRVPK